MVGEVTEGQVYKGNLLGRLEGSCGLCRRPGSVGRQEDGSRVSATEGV